MVIAPLAFLKLTPLTFLKLMPTTDFTWRQRTEQLRMEITTRDIARKFCLAYEYRTLYRLFVGAHGMYMPLARDEPSTYNLKRRSIP